MKKSLVPTSIGIIMDGNRRWARAHNLPTHLGHERGYEKAKEVAQWCADAGVKYMILYAFSHENWNRSPEEVAYLKKLFTSLLRIGTGEFRAQGGAVRFIGNVERFGKKFTEGVKKLEATNPKNPRSTVVVALSYGGRQEIVGAVNELLQKKRSRVTEKEFSTYLYTAGIPDPDLIIRTSGEQRLSGFLPWQSTYSELMFIDKNWPDFLHEDFDAALKEFASRQRRHGK